MRVTFWGVRGSLPWATADSIGHGCNTPCVEIRDDTTGALLILDAGSGILGAGRALRADPRAVAILLTHYHWDHTQGLPFFDPFYNTGWTPAIWSPKLGTIDTGWVRSIFAHPYYPVSYDQLSSPPVVHLIDEGERAVGGFQVRAQLVSHPGGAFAYRIAGPTGDVVYATDHEFGDPALDAAFASFAAGAGAIVLDAHFTPEELPAHRGWGHGSWRQCAEFAAAHGIGRLFLFHHKPGRSDAAMAAIETSARAIFAPTHAAREGISFDV